MALLAHGACFSMATSNNAEPNAGLSADRPGTASAGGRGEGADDTSLQGNESTCGADIFSVLGGHTVAAQIDAMAKAEGRDPGPAQKRATAKAQNEPAKPKRQAQAEADSEDEHDESPDTQQEETGATDGPILPDDETEADATDKDDADSTDDGEEGDDTTTQELARKAKALEKDNFKNREKLREARATIEAKEARIKELEQQAQNGATTLTGLPAGFEKARTLADIDSIEADFERALEWAEDHEEGYTGKDEQGNEVEYTAQQVRSYRRNIARLAKNAAKAREQIQQRETRRTEAIELTRKKYPFVLDADSPRQALVKEIENEFEEIKTSPARDLLLGRLAVAKLIESGEYEIVRKSKAKPAAAAPEKKVSVTPASPPPVRKTPPRTQAAETEDWTMSLARMSMPQAA